MITIDATLTKRNFANDHARAALVDGRYMSRCIALKIATTVRGMCLAAIAN